MNYLTISSCADAISQGCFEIKAITSLMQGQPQSTGHEQSQKLHLLLQWWPHNKLPSRILQIAPMFLLLSARIVRDRQCFMWGADLTLCVPRNVAVDFPISSEKSREWTCKQQRRVRWAQAKNNAKTIEKAKRIRFTQSTMWTTIKCALKVMYLMEKMYLCDEFIRQQNVLDFWIVNRRNNLINQREI